MKNFLHALPRYWKTLIASVPFVVLVGNEVVQAVSDKGADGSLSTQDLFTIVLTGLAAVGVYGKANTPPAGELPRPDISEVG